MKTIFTSTALLSMATIFLLLFTATVNPQDTPAKSKILVTYFTFPEADGVDASTGASRIIVDKQMYGTTEYVAKVIGELTGADMFQVKTVHNYPNRSHQELIDYAKKEADTKTYPKMTSKIRNFDDYDTIFVGFPNWWYDMPMVIYTLFNEYDFSGKTIIPFCTHGGSGFSQSVQTIANLEKKAKVVSMPAISRNSAAQSRNGIIKWLKNNNFTVK